ncbi:MAG: DNA gyrase subunit A, partial [Deltaproteobacteria bacterium]|nr:DNA gyrase subunit A [Deltaproteobacteria bacterium]
DLSEIQAQAILDMRLQRLTGLEQEKILEEYETVLKDIRQYKEILASDHLVLEIVKEELSQIREEFGDSRRTEITQATKEITLEDMIAEEDMVVTISKSGYIKRNPITLYQQQHRGGKGKTAMMTKDEDFVEHLFVASTHHYFLFFTNNGKVYWCKVYDIPQAGRTRRGKAVVNLLDFDENEKLTTVLAVPAFEPGYHIMMATRNGTIKKTDLMAYSRPRTGGIIALNLAEGDELISVRITDGTMNVFLCTAKGKSIRFLEADIRPSGRVARGVRGIRLVNDDNLIGMEVLSHGQTITIKTSIRNGNVVAILLVEEDDDIMLVADSGKLIRMAVKSISVISRNTQGVKLIGMGFQEKVAGAARLAEKEEQNGV